MLTLLTLKSTLKKTWTWLRHNWYVPAVIVYTLVLWFLFKNKAGALKVLEIRSKSYESQIKTIEEAHKKEIEARDQILKNYDNVLTQLEKDYEEKNMKLDTKKKKEIKKIVKEFNDRPDDLAKILAERYGIDYVE
jgi:DNA polymerase II small subunit/DNA polymerase delta subunit B